MKRKFSTLKLARSLSRFAMLQREKSQYLLLLDIVLELPRETTPKEINQLLKDSSESGVLKGILGYSDLPLVSGKYKFTHETVSNDLRLCVLHL